MSPESQALMGKAIVNTRAPHQATDLNALLTEYGAQPLSYPCIDIAPPDDPAPLDAALQTAAQGGFDWLILTSANTVYSLKFRLEALNIAWETLDRMKVAVIGTVTAAVAAELLGLKADVIPDEYVAESLSKSLTGIRGQRVFLPQSAIAAPTLKDALANMGAAVTAVDAYQTVIGSGGVDLPGLLKSNSVDVIIFTSPSTVQNLLKRLTREGGDRDHLNTTALAAIGPKTAHALEKETLPVTVMPDEHTISGVVAALTHYFETSE